MKETKIAKMFIGFMIVLTILSVSVQGVEEFLQSPSASYVSQSYNRGTGFFWRPNETVNFTSVSRNSIEAGTHFTIYDNDSLTLQFEGTFVTDFLLVGIIVNESEMYSIMVNPVGCGNRANAHDTGLSGSYPITTSKGIIISGAISTAGCGAPEIATTGDGYSFDSWNVTEIPSPAPPPSEQNTSLLLTSFNESDFTFGTSTFFTAFSVEFNTTIRHNASVFSSFNILKLSGGATNIVSGRILYDGIIISDEQLRTVTGLNDEGSTGFKPVVIDNTVGSHNLSFQYRRTGGGNININDIDLLLLSGLSTSNVTVHHDINMAELTHSSNSFVNSFSYLDNEAVNKYIFTKMTLQGLGETRANYFFRDIANDLNSSVSRRHLSSASDIGSLSLIFNNFIDINISLFTKTSDNNVTINATIIDISLEDHSNNTIKSFNGSNPNSDFDSVITLSSGIHRILNLTHTSIEGDTIFLSATISFNSTVSHTPTIIINSTNQSITCFSKKERFLSDSSDIGNVFLFAECNAGIVTNSGYEFNLIVDTDNDLTIIDEFMSGIETTTQSTFNIPLVPAINIFSNFTNNTIRFNEDELRIQYNFSLGVANAFDNANCTFIVDSVVNVTHLNRSPDINYLFNYTVNTQEFTNRSLGIECTTLEVSALDGDYLYRIDTFLPRINTSFVNLSNFEKDTLIEFDITCTDNNIFATNLSWFDANDILLLNSFQENLTGNNVTVETSRIGLTTGNNFYNRVICWDDHNPLPNEKSVRELQWYFENNNLIADNDITFSGDIKQFTGQGEPATYFYLSENKHKAKITFNNISKVQFINLKTSNNLQLRNTIHKGHFVYFSLKRFIDFNGENIDYLDINRIAQNEYDIYIHLYTASDEIELESIGDLNVFEEIYFYDVVDTSGDINLTGIENALLQGLSDIGGSVMFLALIFFTALFFFLAIIIKQPLYWSFSGGGFLLIGVKFIDLSLRQGNDTLFNFVGAIFFITFGLIISLLSVFLFIKNRIAIQESKNNMLDYDI